MIKKHIRSLLAIVLTAFAVAGASADTVKRSVDADGVPVLTIRGSGNPKSSSPAAIVARPRKEFKVYNLEGEGGSEGAPSGAQVVVIPFPPPIAPNPAAYNGYGYGWYPPAPCYPNYYGPLPGAGYPVNYQNPPLNYQSPPVDYQNPPINTQRPFASPAYPHRARH